jgi:hypothetical protein
MFGSQALETVIGLVLMFSIISRGRRDEFAPPVSQA